MDLHDMQTASCSSIMSTYEQIMERAEQRVGRMAGLERLCLTISRCALYLVSTFAVMLMFVEGVFGSLITRAFDNLDGAIPREVAGYVELALVLLMFAGVTFVSWKATKQWKTPERRKEGTVIDYK